MRMVRLLGGWLILWIAGVVWAGTDSLYQQAVQALQRGRDAQVLALYQQALQQESVEPAWFYVLGHVWFRRGQYEEAFQAYQKGLTVLPQRYHAWIWNNMGNVRWKQGQLRHAIFCYSQALKQNSQYQRARYNLEKALEELHKQKKKRGEPPPPRMTRKRPPPPRKRKTAQPPSRSRLQSRKTTKTPEDRALRLEDFNRFFPYSQLRGRKQPDKN